MRALVARTAVVFALWSVGVAAFGQYVDVHIQANPGAGKGVAVTRGMDCFVITAGHVVRDPVPTTVIGVQRRNSPARVHWADAQSDLAVLKVANPAEICSGDYYLDSRNVLSRLDLGARAALNVRREDGTREEFGFTIAAWNDHHITVRPGPGAGDLYEGLSGAMLYIGGSPAGILVSVSTGPESKGKVLRIDRIEALIGSFLALQRPGTGVDAQLANDILRKNVNFLETPAFCGKLYELARWMVELTPPLEYTQKDRVGRDYHYQIPSLLIPGTSGTYYESESASDKSKYVMVTTTIGTYTQNLAPEPFERRAEAAVNECVQKVRKGIAKFLAHAGGPDRKRDELGTRTSWHLYYINNRGRYSASIFLHVNFDDDRLTFTAGRPLD